MNLPTFRIERVRHAGTMLAVVLYGIEFSGSGAQAANLLSVSPATVAVTCNTLTGPGPAATFVVKSVAALTGTGAIAVAPGAIGGGLGVTAPSPAILNSANQAQGLTYTVSLGAGCSGAVSGANVIRFYAGGAADTSVTINVGLTAKESALVASPVLLNCGKSTGAAAAYTPGGAQSSLLTSLAAGGTPFTVDATTLPAWLALPPTTTKTAGVKGVYITMAPVAPCGNYLPGSSNTASIRLKNPPAPDALIPVTLQILGASPLIVTPAAPAISYTKGSGTPAFVDVALSSTASKVVTFAIDTSTVPAWLSVDALAGSAPRTLRFSTTSVAEAIAQGSYSATIRVQSPGFGDLTVPFTLAVANPPSKLTVSEGTTRNIPWMTGQPLPFIIVTLASSDAPIPYTIVGGGTLSPIVGSAFLTGYAYSHSTPIPVTFDPAVFQGAQTGDVLSGTLTVTWGSPVSTTVVTINVTLQSAAAAVTSITPVSLPTAGAGETFTVALSGSGFVTGSDSAPATTVGIVSGGSLVPDANIVATVINSSNIILAITVPKSADPLLPFGASGAGGTVKLGVCNPGGAACTIPTGIVNLLITPSPVIQAVTSAAAFLQATPPALSPVAPYDMISLFGASFCVSGGTGCTDGQVLYGNPDPYTLRYPASLSPDTPDTVRRVLTVVFQTHATPPVVIASAPLLFATNRQINILVPAAVSSYVGKTIDLVVNFGHLPAASMLSSEPFPVRAVAADPGLFTIGTDGQGDGAILGTDWSIIAAGNEAGMRANAADSDTVQIYMTGLGAPDSTGNNASAGSGQWPADCVSTASYVSALNLQTGGSSNVVDGLRIDGAVLNANRLPPCLGTTAAIPTVTIGGQPATVTYAGWVTGSVAGQYQVNVKLPGSAAGTFVTAAGTSLAAPLTAAVQLPVVVTERGFASQPGVTIWVAPRLKVTAPTALQNAAGAPWPSSGNAVSAAQGTAPYKYAVTGGALPAGVTLDPATGAISGTPLVAARGTYVVTVTATDSTASPLTGTVTFTLLAN
jgi:uncharacterized protein (TIGR03437 family)